MKLVFTLSACADYLHWQEMDEAVLARLNAVLKDCLRSPFAGIGKPEPLLGGSRAAGPVVSPANIVWSIA